MNNGGWLIAGLAIGALYFRKFGEGISFPTGGLGKMGFSEGGNYARGERVGGIMEAFDGPRPTGNTYDTNANQDLFDGTLWMQPPPQGGTAEPGFQARGGVDISPPRATAKPWRPIGGGWA